VSIQKTLYLLGAGASIDAGLPSAAKLTAALFGNKSQSGRTLKQYLEKADHVAVDMLCRFYTEKPALGFEQLFDRLEAMIESGSSILNPDGTVDTQASAWLSDPHANMILRTIKRAAINSVIPSRYDENQCGYLKPLVVKCLNEDIPIVSLNYDLLIETILQRMQAEADCGPVKCEYPKPKSGKLLRLIKIHGSLDWSSEFPSGYSRGTTSPALIEHGIIAGKKLTHRSPFWDEYLEFRKQVEKADTIVALGFSFQDLHVTDPLIEWLYASSKNVLHVVLPCGLPEILEARLSPEVKHRCYSHKKNAAAYLNLLDNPRLNMPSP
jgi:SIR2-like domain